MLTLIDRAGSLWPSLYQLVLAGKQEAGDVSLVHTPRDLQEMFTDLRRHLGSALAGDAPGFLVTGTTYSAEASRLPGWVTLPDGRLLQPEWILACDGSLSRRLADVPQTDKYDEARRSWRDLVLAHLARLRSSLKASAPAKRRGPLQEREADQQAARSSAAGRRLPRQPHGGGETDGCKRPGVQAAPDGSQQEAG